MNQNNVEFNHIDIFEIKRCLIVPIQLDLYDEFIVQLQKTLLERLNNELILGVILDLSAIKIIDSINLNNIIKLCDMTRMMGKETIIIGIHPSIASVLTEFPELELGKLITFINLEQSINYLQQHSKKNSQERII